jgi:hypothetical protein
MDVLSLKRFDLKRPKRASDVEDMRENESSTSLFPGASRAYVEFAPVRSAPPPSAPLTVETGISSIVSQNEVPASGQDPTNRSPPPSVAARPCSPSPPSHYSVSCRSRSPHQDIILRYNEHGDGPPTVGSVQVTRPSVEEWERDRDLGLGLQQRAQRELARQVSVQASCKLATLGTVGSSSTESVVLPLATESQHILQNSPISSVSSATAQTSSSSTPAPSRSSKLRSVRRAELKVKPATTIPSTTLSPSPSLFSLALRMPSRSTATLVSPKPMTAATSVTPATPATPVTHSPGRIASLLRPRSKNRAGTLPVNADVTGAASSSEMLDAWEVVETSSCVLDPALDEQLPLPSYPAYVLVPTESGMTKKALVSVDSPYPLKHEANAGSALSLLSRFPAPPATATQVVLPSSDVTPSPISLPTAAEGSIADSEQAPKRRKPPPPPPPKRKRPAKSASVGAMHGPRPRPSRAEAAADNRMSLPPPPRYCSTYADTQPAIPFPSPPAPILEETTDISSAGSSHPRTSPSSSRTSFSSPFEATMATTDQHSEEECPSDDDEATPSLWQTPLTSPMVSRGSYIVFSDSDDEDDYVSVAEAGSANGDDASVYRVSDATPSPHAKGSASAAAVRYAADPYMAWNSPPTSWIAPDEWNTTPPRPIAVQKGGRTRAIAVKVESPHNTASSSHPAHYHPQVIYPSVPPPSSVPVAHMPPTPLCSHMMPPFYVGYPPFFQMPSPIPGQMPFYYPYPYAPTTQSAMYSSHGIPTHIVSPTPASCMHNPHDVQGGTVLPVSTSIPPSRPTAHQAQASPSRVTVRAEPRVVPMLNTGRPPPGSEPLARSRPMPSAFSPARPFSVTSFPGTTPISPPTSIPFSLNTDRPLPVPPGPSPLLLAHAHMSPLVESNAGHSRSEEATPSTPRSPRSPGRPEGPRPSPSRKAS